MLTRMLVVGIIAVAFAALFAHDAGAQRQPVGGKAGGFIKVQAEGKLKTGIMAIGGETTGMVIVNEQGADQDPDVGDRRRLGEGGRQAAYRDSAAVIEASDLDAAIALASQVPAARMGGCVEIRPVRGFLR